MIVAYLTVLFSLAAAGLRAIPPLLRAIHRGVTWLLDAHERGLERVAADDGRPLL